MISADIEQQIRNIVNDLGYELWACEYLPQGKHSLLRIYIDKADGIQIGDCEVVSRELSAFLDVEEPIKGNYSLEVSSPGIPRPLFSVEHFRHYVTQTVALKLIKPIDNSRKIMGKIVEVQEDNTITLQVGEQRLQVPFSLIVKANLTGE
ncbi:MAG: ribosome maturation factor RimP [Legionellaceae bacterium]|nr:ribosome maturation factor RimP [Legionellaceae bacterium]